MKMKKNFNTLSDYFYIPQSVRGVAIVSVLLFLLRLVYVSLGPVDLSPDEAHYWEWSRYLDWSYYSKPPMTAWLNYVSTSLFGHTHLGVRFFSCMAISVLGFLAFLMARNAAGQAAGWLAFVFVQITPLFAAGGLMMTPDIPSLTLWVFALYLLSLIDFSQKQLSMRCFVVLGVVVGFAGLSKYTAAAFYPLLALYLWFTPGGRYWLMKPHIYVAGLVSLAMQMPVFYWNFINDFVGFKHVLGQNAPSSRYDLVRTFTNFLGGQAGVLSPITFILMIASWCGYGYVVFKKGLGAISRSERVLFVFGFTLFVLFFSRSFFGKVQPNWPVMATFPGLVLMAVWVWRRGVWLKSLAGFGMALSLLLTVISHDTFILRNALQWMGVDYELSFKRDPLKPALGWRGLGKAASALVESHVTGDYYVLTSRYQTASSLSFYMKGNPKVLYVNLGNRRQNQYDYWPWPSDVGEKPVIYIRENGGMDAGILAGFEGCAELGEVASRREHLLMRRASVYACFGYKGLDRKLVDRY